MVLAKCRITVREVAEDVDISIDSGRSILINDLSMRQIVAIMLIYRCLYTTFWPKTTNTLMMPQPPYSPDLAHVFFFVSEIEEAHEITTLIYVTIAEIKTKSKGVILYYGETR